MTKRWSSTIRRRWRCATLATGVAGVAALGWAGYHASDSQLALAALWSLCAPVR